MSVKLADIIRMMDDIAPPFLAEQWDNAGLQVGQSEWKVQSIWVALDPSPTVVEAACKANVDLLITHHPLLMKPIQSVDFKSVTGRIIFQAARHNLAVFSAHTNLDSTIGGINDVLADIVGVTRRTPMIPAAGEEMVKLVLFVPKDFEEKILEALFQTEAGRIGQYSCCAFLGKGEGTFLPGQNAKPFSGEPGRLTRAAEVRIETIVPRKAVSQVVTHIQSRHPYETMAYDVYPLIGAGNEGGMGRMGFLSETTRLDTMAENLKKKLNLPSIRIVGREDLSIKTVAVCSGSGASLINRFLSSKADAFVSGDFRYHDARIIEEADRGLIDIGHFASEHLILTHLAVKLRQAIAGIGHTVLVDVCPLEKDPFRVL